LTSLLDLLRKLAGTSGISCIVFLAGPFRLAVIFDLSTFLIGTGKKKKQESDLGEETGFWESPLPV
jgi:hypothetical protein